MADNALGEKHVCGACSSRFYDLNKTPVICPKCGAEEQKHDACLNDTVPVEAEEDHAVMVDEETSIDLSEFNEDVEAPTDDMPKGLDAMESLDDEDHEIESLSELENREIHEQQVGHDDGADEEELIDTMQDGVLLVDEIVEEEVRA